MQYFFFFSVVLENEEFMELSELYSELCKLKSRAHDMSKSSFKRSTGTKNEIGLFTEEFI